MSNLPTSIAPASASAAASAPAAAPAAVGLSGVAPPASVQERFLSDEEIYDAFAFLPLLQQFLHAIAATAAAHPNPPAANSSAATSATSQPQAIHRAVGPMAVAHAAGSVSVNSASASSASASSSTSISSSTDAEAPLTLIRSLLEKLFHARHVLHHLPSIHLTIEQQQEEYERLAAILQKKKILAAKYNLLPPNAPAPAENSRK